MEITWLGYSCFRLKGKNVTVITDPCPPELGYTLERQNANVVTVSHNHPNHAYTQISQPAIPASSPVPGNMKSVES